MKDDAPARHKVVLGTSIQPNVDLRIPRVKISDFSTKSYEPKKPEIQTSAEIKHASIEKAIGRWLTV
jgi:hypothetical protein